jgi:hypothetical protein
MKSLEELAKEILLGADAVRFAVYVHDHLDENGNLTHDHAREVVRHWAKKIKDGRTA